MKWFIGLSTVGYQDISASSKQKLRAVYGYEEQQNAPQVVNKNKMALQYVGANNESSLKTCTSNQRCAQNPT